MSEPKISVDRDLLERLQQYADDITPVYREVGRSIQQEMADQADNDWLEIQRLLEA